LRYPLRIRRDCFAVLSLTGLGRPWWGLGRGACTRCTLTDQGRTAPARCSFLPGWRFTSRTPTTCNSVSLRHSRTGCREPLTLATTSCMRRRSKSPRKASSIWHGVPSHTRNSILSAAFRALGTYECIDSERYPCAYFGAVVERSYPDYEERAWEEVLHRFDEMLTRVRPRHRRASARNRHSRPQHHRTSRPELGRPLAAPVWPYRATHAHDRRSVLCRLPRESASSGGRLCCMGALALLRAVKSGHAVDRPPVEELRRTRRHHARPGTRDAKFPHWRVLLPTVRQSGTRDRRGHASVKLSATRASSPCASGGPRSSRPRSRGRCDATAATATSCPRSSPSPWRRTWPRRRCRAPAAGSS
jgi:hypothetical protein